MELIPSIVSVPFEITYDSPSLFVGMSVYDMTTGSPVLVGSVLAMTNVSGTNTYFVKTILADSTTFLFIKQVYTDGTYAVVDTNYPAGSESGFTSAFGSIGAQLTQLQNSVNLLVGQTSSAQYVGLITGVVYTGNGIPTNQPQQNQAQIIQGAKAALLAKFLNPITLDPFDLTTVTEISTCFTNSDDTELMLTLSGGGINIISGVLGKIQINLNAMQTAVLAVTDQETMEFSFTFGISDPIKVQIPQAYAVLATVC